MSTAATLQLSTLMVEVKRPKDRHVDRGFFQEACELMVLQDRSNARIKDNDYHEIVVTAGQDEHGNNTRIFISIPIEHDENGVSDQLKSVLSRKLEDLLTDITVISIGFDH